jgi:predicted O-linked N-acetylglucosamine transferase (SPINDLY family)
MDYIIADKIIIPKENQKFYSEKILYLPDTYQPNDSKKVISDYQFSKNELGLPDNKMIYCCFNNSFKINPKTFSSWMEILRSVDGSVLWLLADNPSNESNLVMEAAKHGISKERLVFANRVSLPMHLARHRQADLFLDTLPYNAHTTASDALWAGLPVLTISGNTFAGRVAASLLNAVGLNELIVKTREEFIELAVYLGRNKGQLDKYKNYLADSRMNLNLFDSRKYVKNLESAYKLVHQRRLNNLPPENISIVNF